MDYESLLNENKLLREENEKLKKQLENYNNSRKNYYENNKEIVNQKSKERLKKMTQEDPERLRRYLTFWLLPKQSSRNTWEQLCRREGDRAR
jgi:cell division septum initiation protein DivIVA